MIEDKRGIGTSISMWFVLIVILAIAIVFVVISASIGSFRNSDLPESHEDEFLLSQVIIRGDEVFVLEAITLYSQEKIDRETIDGGLVGLVNERDSCLALILGNKEKPAESTGVLNAFFIKFENGEADSLQAGVPSYLKTYNSEGVLSDLSYLDPESQEMIYVQYYYGKCLEEFNG